MLDTRVGDDGCKAHNKVVRGAFAERSGSGCSYSKDHDPRGL